MAAEVDTVAIPRDRAKTFLEKAREFLRGAERSLAEGDRNSAGLLAIHAGISACDCLTVARLGLRSKSERHHDVLRLLKRLPGAGGQHLSRQVRELLDEKNRVEYEDALLLTADADKMVLLAKRVVRTAEEAFSPASS